MPFYGAPLRIPNRSLTSVLIVEPTLGLDVSQPSVDAPLGSTPDSDNYIMREGSLEPRPMLSLRQSGAHVFNANTRVLGGQEIVDVTGVRYSLTQSTTSIAWYSNTSWSQLSYVSAGGIDAPPSGTATDYWDTNQIYFDLRDENIAVFGNDSYQSLYCWQSNTTVFSTLTGAPRARRITTHDNFILAANVRSGNSDFVQRIQWSDRGSASSWTGGLSGYEDLLAARGGITRLMSQENQVIVLFDNETWRGLRSDFPSVFRFEPLDANVGCPYPWTAADTPLGVIFLGRDYHVYLLPKGGGQPQPIGQRLHRAIRNLIDQPQRAWGHYDHQLDAYRLFYPIKGGTGLPQREVALNLQSGAWAPQSYDRVSGNLSLTRGFEVQLSSSATTWGGLAAAGIRWADLAMSWAELGGASEERALLAGSSTGTAYYFNSNATSDTGTSVPCYWQSSALLGDEPSLQHTLTEVRVDYQADSASSLTVRISQNQGASFGGGQRISLPQTSGISQAVAYPYVPARYPMIRVESEGQRHRLFRFFLTLRRGGR